MADAKKPDPRFVGASDYRGRLRGKNGKFASGLGAPAQGEHSAAVSRALKKRDYRAFLEAIEPAALGLLEKALRSTKVPMKERIGIAMELVTRLHGKTVQNLDADKAKQKVENMSHDDLREYVKGLMAELESSGSDLPTLPEGTEGQIIN